MGCSVSAKKLPGSFRPTILISEIRWLGFILPDVNRPVVDLFAAETCCNPVNTAAYLLQDDLNQISPVILGYDSK